jgi:deoxycytidine triphosphate deaminase
MLLSYTKLRELQNRGVITNSLPEHVNSASIDITLGSEALVESVRDVSGEDLMIDLRARKPLNTERVKIDPEGGLYLPPGTFILAQSEQVFHLPNDISCEYKLKSSLARAGLEHMNAGWCDAGWHGSVLTLEFKNITQFHTILIRPGDPIGQVVFFVHEPVPEEASYARRGRYNNDRRVEGVKL